MPLAARKSAVESFQTDPSRRIFLISLKAGGTGLNLTAASRVIHFDLWYNPAIEDQATDRAFRIGQQRTISRLSLRSGETWIGKMSNEELTNLFG